MATLLDYPAPDYGPSVQLSWGNKPLRDDSGKIVQVRSVGRATPLHTVRLGWTRAGADLAAFRTALRALKGGYLGCYFYTPSYWEWWDDAAAGVGDGIEGHFPFGGCGVQATPAPVVKVATVVQSATDYAIAAAAGDSLNRWQVTFAAGHEPAALAAVTISFQGRRLLLGRLASDPGPLGTPGYGVSTLAVELQGEEV